ncbi:MAG: hypothetical protein EA414_15120 [Arthrospira sp. PLM2.Bin9]|nr:RAMP superfamily CRISPR-associated protein [Arthrospira sp. PLM2.Bin9]TVU52888.1 MAG: hypothetical protein EA414_15120 [Arthrospira sp. PLM2.Bin9]
MSNVIPTLPQNLILTITMKSDWHVGSGSGRGEIDSIVQRDADGLPYIPAKTLTGILRDGCEQVAQALDGDLSGKWNDWVNFLFGDQPALAKGVIEEEPRPASLSIRSAHLDRTLRDALGEKPKLQQAIAFIKPGVSIDAKTGSAKPDCLRFEEVVRMDAVLTTGFELNFSETTSITDPAELQRVQQVCYALLIAGAKMVNRLGGKRRRGVGSCEIKVDEKEKDWLEWFQKNHAGIQDCPDVKPDKLPSSTATTNLQQTEIWYKVPLKIKTRSPLVLPARTVGNVVKCLDYIPGRYLLRYLHKKLGDTLNVSQAIAQNHLVITNATIEIDKVAGRPTPFCLFGKKVHGGLGKGKKVYNRFQESEPNDTQLKGERGGYIGQLNNSELPKYQKIDFELYTHNTIKDEVQRPTREVGGIYSYEAIPAGLTFRAELRIPDSVQKHLAGKDKNWFQKLAGNTRIGQSKKDQYGAINIEVESPEQITKQAGSDSSLYVWFVSDVLMRGKRLNPTVDPDDFKNALAGELGLKPEDLKEREIDGLLSMMLRQRRTESWQVRWGLPRPSMVGWQAGSCIVYDVKEGAIAPQKLAELEAKGIGDRRAEGYGQILFNDPLLNRKLSDLKRKNKASQDTKNNSVILSKSSNSGNNKKVSNAVFDYARMIETAAWREAIQNKAVAIAAEANKRQEILGISISSEGSQPPMSQLGGLRSVMGKLTDQNKSNSVNQWIQAIQKVENRKKKWPGKSLDDIKNLVTDFNKIWQILDVDELSKGLTITENGKTKLQADLWAEAVRTLVDAMIRSHKRDLEKVQSKGME